MKYTGNRGLSPIIPYYSCPLLFMSPIIHADANPNDAQHTQGNAFDVSEDYTINPLQDVLDAGNPPQDIQQFLDAPKDCGLTWGGTFSDNYDPIHFGVRRPAP